jgi:prepilin-type N-terminal cleavage/methylation domain-containing protein/prepilin-type processing-associated H-X9-DG protein
VHSRENERLLLHYRGFTLVELLVVIGVIALLRAIFIPALRAAREHAQRAVCLSNLRQLTMAWVAYADDHDGKLVRGTPYAYTTAGPRRLETWLSGAFMDCTSRSDLMEGSDKGALWRYIQDVDVYRCPRGWEGHLATYNILPAANGPKVEGTHMPDTGGREFTPVGRRVGSTVLRITRLTDITSPGAGKRAVFFDEGHVPTPCVVHYLYRRWAWPSPPPIQHANGMTLSMADGHAEYWKWKGRETVSGLPREPMFIGDNLRFDELLEDDYEPQTDDGLYDLQRLQRATWGRLGYGTQEGP